MNAPEPTIQRGFLVIEREKDETIYSLAQSCMNECP